MHTAVPWCIVPTYQLVNINSFADGVLTMDDFRAVCRALYPARPKWRVIGICLDLKHTDMLAIKHDHGGEGSERCLEEMVAMWLNRHELHPSWPTLVDALMDEMVDEQSLAYNIRRDINKPAGGRSYSQISTPGMSK